MRKKGTYCTRLRPVLRIHTSKAVTTRTAMITTMVVVSSAMVEGTRYAQRFPAQLVAGAGNASPAAKAVASTAAQAVRKMHALFAREGGGIAPDASIACSRLRELQAVPALAPVSPPSKTKEGTRGSGSLIQRSSWTTRQTTVSNEVLARTPRPNLTPQVFC